MSAAFDKHEENVDSITGQRDAHLAGTDMGNGSAPRLQGKERIITGELKQPVEKHEENIDSITGQSDAQSVGTGMGNGLAKAAIAGVVGALITVATALAGKVTAQRINRTVKGVGDAVKDVAMVLTTLQKVQWTVKDTVEDG